MNANENLEKKRKNARAIVEMGVALMSSSIVLFLIISFSCYTIILHVIHDPPLDGLEACVIIAIPVLIEALIFVLGFILLLIGLLVGLIGRLKKQESL